MSRPLAWIVLLTLAGCGQGSDGGDGRAAAGAECPALSAQDFAARGIDLVSGSTMNGVGVRRLRGASSCRIGEGGEPTCQLSDPGTVEVAAGGSSTYFDVPQGRNATITVSGGQARCVLN